MKLSQLPLNKHYAYCETCNKVHDRSKMTRVEDFGYLCDECTGFVTKSKPYKEKLIWGEYSMVDGNEQEEALRSFQRL